MNTNIQTFSIWVVYEFKTATARSNKTIIFTTFFDLKVAKLKNMLTNRGKKG